MAAIFFCQAILPAHALTSKPQIANLVSTSSVYSLAVLRGVRLNPKNPLSFEFIIDTADSKDTDKDEVEKLVRYFFAGLTLPKDQVWVNLSPHEQNRVCPDELAVTELGKGMLAQDAFLKQLAASLSYPESKTGKSYWEKIYKLAQEKFGTTTIPLDTFNKVWIVPDKASVYEEDGAYYVSEARLKVMMEADYEAMRNQKPVTSNQKNTKYKIRNTKSEKNKLTTAVMREVILPVIEEEVNNGKNFAQLRQMYYALILATYLKTRLKQFPEKDINPRESASIFNNYINKSKIKGIDTVKESERERIYKTYVEAYKNGVYNYIRRERENVGVDLCVRPNKTIRRRYFSGGLELVPEAVASPLKPIPFGPLKRAVVVASPVRNADSLGSQGIGYYHSHPGLVEREKAVRGIASPVYGDAYVRRTLRGIVKNEAIIGGLKVIRDDGLMAYIANEFNRDSILGMEWAAQGRYINWHSQLAGGDSKTKAIVQRWQRYIKKQYGLHAERIAVVGSKSRVSSARHEILHDHIEMLDQARPRMFKKIFSFFYAALKNDAKLCLACQGLTTKIFSTTGYRGHETMADDLKEWTARFFEGSPDQKESSQRYQDYVYIRAHMPKALVGLFEQAGFIWPVLEELAALPIVPIEEILDKTENIDTSNKYKQYVQTMTDFFMQRKNPFDEEEVNRLVIEKAQRLGIENPWQIIKKEERLIESGIKEIIRIISSIRVSHNKQVVFLGSDADKLKISWDLIHPEQRSLWFNINTGDLLIPRDKERLKYAVRDKRIGLGYNSREILDSDIRETYGYRAVKEILSDMSDWYKIGSLMSRHSTENNFVGRFKHEFTEINLATLDREAFRDVLYDLADRFYKDILAEHKDIVIMDSAKFGVQPWCLYGITSCLSKYDSRFQGVNINLRFIVPSLHYEYPSTTLNELAKHSNILKLSHIRKSVMEDFVTVKETFKPVSHRYLAGDYKKRPFKMRSARLQLLAFYSLLVLYNETQRVKAEKAANSVRRNSGDTQPNSQSKTSASPVQREDRSQTTEDRKQMADGNELKIKNEKLKMKDEAGSPVLSIEKKAKHSSGDSGEEASWQGQGFTVEQARLLIEQGRDPFIEKVYRQKKLLADVEQKFTSYQRDLSRKVLERNIEEPIIDACWIFMLKGIFTTWSTANKLNVLKEDVDESYRNKASINFVWLSSENEKIIRNFPVENVAENGFYFTYENKHGSLVIPVTKESTVQYVYEKAVRAANVFKAQGKRMHEQGREFDWSGEVSASPIQKETQDARGNTQDRSYTAQRNENNSASPVNTKGMVSRISLIFEKRTPKELYTINGLYRYLENNHSDLFPAHFSMEDKKYFLCLSLEDGVLAPDKKETICDVIKESSNFFVEPNQNVQESFAQKFQNEVNLWRKKHDSFDFFDDSVAVRAIVEEWSSNNVRNSLSRLFIASKETKDIVEVLCDRIEEKPREYAGLWEYDYCRWLETLTDRQLNSEWQRVVVAYGYRQIHPLYHMTPFQFLADEAQDFMPTHIWQYFDYDTEKKDKLQRRIVFSLAATNVLFEWAARYNGQAPGKRPENVSFQQGTGLIEFLYNPFVDAERPIRQAFDAMSDATAWAILAEGSDVVRGIGNILKEPGKTDSSVVSVGDSMQQTDSLKDAGDTSTKSASPLSIKASASIDEIKTVFEGFQKTIESLMDGSDYEKWDWPAIKQAARGMVPFYEQVLKLKYDSTERLVLSTFDGYVRGGYGELDFPNKVGIVSVINLNSGEELKLAADQLQEVVRDKKVFEKVFKVLDFVKDKTYKELADGGFISHHYSGTHRMEGLKLIKILGPTTVEQEILLTMEDKIRSFNRFIEAETNGEAGSWDLKKLHEYSLELSTYLYSAIDTYPKESLPYAVASTFLHITHSKFPQLELQSRIFSPLNLGNDNETKWRGAVAKAIEAYKQSRASESMMAVLNYVNDYTFENLDKAGYIGRHYTRANNSEELLYTYIKVDNPDILGGKEWEIENNAGSPVFPEGIKKVIYAGKEVSNQELRVQLDKLRTQGGIFNARFNNDVLEMNIDTDTGSSFAHDRLNYPQVGEYVFRGVFLTFPDDAPCLWLRMPNPAIIWEDLSCARVRRDYIWIARVLLANGYCPEAFFDAVTVVNLEKLWPFAEPATLAELAQKPLADTGGMGDNKSESASPLEVIWPKQPEEKFISLRQNMSAWQSYLWGLLNILMYQIDTTTTAYVEGAHEQSPAQFGQWFAHGNKIDQPVIVPMSRIGTILYLWKSSQERNKGAFLSEQDARDLKNAVNDLRGRLEKFKIITGGDREDIQELLHGVKHSGTKDDMLQRSEWNNYFLYKVFWEHTQGAQRWQIFIQGIAAMDKAVSELAKLVPQLPDNNGNSSSPQGEYFYPAAKPQDNGGINFSVDQFNIKEDRIQRTENRRQMAVADEKFKTYKDSGLIIKDTLAGLSVQVVLIEDIPTLSFASVGLKE